MLVFIPNWHIHVKWAAKLGIDETIVHVVNRLIDYGSLLQYYIVEKSDLVDGGDHQRVLLKYMYQRDVKTFAYVKAYYVHMLLDHIRESRYLDMTRAIEEFLAEKVLVDIDLANGSHISFSKVLDEVIEFFKVHETEIMVDVNGHAEIP